MNNTDRDEKELDRLAVDLTLEWIVAGLLLIIASAGIILIICVFARVLSGNWLAFALPPAIVSAICWFGEYI